MCVTRRFRDLRPAGALCLSLLAGSLFLALLWGPAALAPALAQSAIDRDISYTVTFDIEGGDEDLETGIRDASNLEALVDEGSVGAAGLVRRAVADYDRIIAVLYAGGYYGGLVTITLAGTPAETDGAIDVVEAREANVPVRIEVEVGPQYTFGEIAYADAATGRPGLPLPIDLSEVEIEPGEPARAEDVLAAEDVLVTAMQELGYPLAEVPRREAVADHAARTLDVTFFLQPGRPAVLGPAEVSGAQDVDAAFIARQANVPVGRQYSPEEIERIRENLTRLEAFQSVRVVLGDEITPDGHIPLLIEVRERKPRFIGFGAAYSTTEGASLNAYWGHRNLFGRAERLRIEGTVSRLLDNDVDDLQYAVTATFEKPGIITPVDDLLVEARAFREAPDAYTRTGGGGEIGIRRRFTHQLEGQITVEAEHARITDPFGTRDYTLIGLPVELSYDSTDDRLNPTEGIRARGSFSPYLEAFGSTLDLFITRGSVSAYRSLDEDDRFIIAGRVAAGTIDGPALPLIPADRRFYAGGGGSVRGYDYQSISPRNAAGELVGGKSLFEASLELRFRVTEQIGIVPFVDVGGAFASATPDFGSNDLRVGAGVGLRYYTAIGPIRVDLATPLDPRPGDPDFAIYVGLGQAF